jgi:ankyrin repeat protein
VARWLLDKGAAINKQCDAMGTSLWNACLHGHLPVASLLLERGADPTIATGKGCTPLMAASDGGGYLKVVRLLLGQPSVKATINQGDSLGRTALWSACCHGRLGVLRALLESGADPTIANHKGTTPMAAAKREPISAEGRRECVAELEVRSCSLLSAPPPLRSRSSG